MKKTKLPEDLKTTVSQQIIKLFSYIFWNSIGLYKGLQQEGEKCYYHLHIFFSFV